MTPAFQSFGKRTILKGPGVEDHFFDTSSLERGVIQEILNKKLEGEGPLCVSLKERCWEKVRSKSRSGQTGKACDGVRRMAETAETKNIGLRESKWQIPESLM